MIIPSVRPTDAGTSYAGRGNWRLNAACRATGDPDDWFSEDPHVKAAAAAVCRGCPVIDDCDAAADHAKERFGIWAGVERAGRPAASRRPFPDPDIVAAYQAGASTTTIAARWKIGRESVAAHVRAAGATMRPRSTRLPARPDITVEAVAMLADRGMSIAKTAAKLGCTEWTVRQRLAARSAGTARAEAAS